MFSPALATNHEELLRHMLKTGSDIPVSIELFAYYMSYYLTLSRCLDAGASGWFHSYDESGWTLRRP